MGRKAATANLREKKSYHPENGIWGKSEKYSPKSRRKCVYLLFAHLLIFESANFFLTFQEQ